MDRAICGRTEPPAGVQTTALLLHHIDFSDIEDGNQVVIQLDLVPVRTLKADAAELIADFVVDTEVQ